MHDHPYQRLADLLAAAPYAGLSDEAAAEAINTGSVPGPVLATITPDEFVGRFTPAEFVASRNSDDAAVQLLMFRLTVRRDPLDLGSGTVQGGLAYMASIGLLSSERAAAIGSPMPGPPITPRESIGWPGPTIWPADVASARAHFTPQE